MIKNLESNFKNIHTKIKSSFTELEGKNNVNISDDVWERPEGGGGNTFVIDNGNFFSNCAVNFSSIYGKELPQAALSTKTNVSSSNGYQAMGVSVISHPNNPYVPTSHMNVRFFGILGKNDNFVDWWVGGGYDLTPFLPFKEDIIEWHSSAKQLLDSYDEEYYKVFSENCNNYFQIPHRNERRGVGGIFFDNFRDLDIEKSMIFLKSIADCYLNSYLKIATSRKNYEFNESEKNFQLIRRGRYAEFNLIYDRGTAFGLQSNGRIESILSSLPTDVKWQYKKDKEYKVLENKLLDVINKDWNV